MHRQAGESPPQIATPASAPAGERPLRALMLADYFPKPANTTMGTWALSQAHALRRAGIDLRVVSFTSWVPRAIARSGGARAYADCPPSHDWDGLRAHYPRWPYYAVRPFRDLFRARPGPQMRLAWAFARRALLRHVREHRPDLVYAHHTLPSGYLAWKLRAETGIPYVITDHSFEYILACERYPARRRVFERVVNGAATVCGVADRMTADLGRIFPGAPVVTVHNGTDPIAAELLCDPRPPQLRDKLVVFSCGMFYERKGFPLLIEAFARVAAKHPSAVLLIAGDGDESRADVHAAVAGAGLGGDRIRLLGRIPHRDVLRHMAWCDLFALVGWDEPFATVFSEAMSAGKPIVTAGDGGICDVVRDGEHGFVVPPKDVAAAAAALDGLLGDPAVRARMGAAGRDLVDRQLTWDANARQMRAIFQGVLQRS